jgi:protein-tyrosine phosphatase
MIDIHSHILPGIDDGARDMEEALKMAQLAVEDGIRVMVATPHLFKHHAGEMAALNEKSVILERLDRFRDRLAAAGIPLEILPGCDVPLSIDALSLLAEDRVLTVNDGKRYLLLELPHFSIPPTLEDICFRLQSLGITPIITHPERQPMILERPERLARLVELGYLAQLTAGSLTGTFGRQVAKVSRQLVKKGHIHVLASDAHNTRRRPPILNLAVGELSKLIGPEQAQAMVTQTPAKIIKGEPLP